MTAFYFQRSKRSKKSKEMCGRFEKNKLLKIDTIMEKLQIRPGKKFKFTVEVELSEAQLNIIAEINGWDSEDVEHMKKLQGWKPITSDPNFCMGLGSDINSFITMGFLAEKACNDDLKTQIKHDDLYYSGYRCKAYQIYKVDYDLVDCEVLLDNFHGCYIALDEDGSIVHIDDDFEE
jgi:hypothetical protein